MKTFIILLITLVGWNGFSESAKPSSDASAAAIDRLREELIGSFTKGDVDGLLRNLDEEVVVTWQNGEVCRGREAVRAFYARMMTGEKRVVSQIKSAPEVLGRQMHGDWAVSWGNLHDKFVLTDGAELAFNSAFTATIIKRGDRWVVAAFHTSVNVFDNAVLSIAVRKVGMWTGIAGCVAGLAAGFFAGRSKRA